MVGLAYSDGVPAIPSAPPPRTPELAKARLRRRMLDARAALTPYDLSLAARDLRDVVLAIPEVRAASTIAAYVSIGREPGTGPLIESLHERGVTVLLPVLRSDNDVDWARYTGAAALAAAARGLLEPTGPRLGVDAVLEAPVVLVPGVAVDRTGTRLGRGGGSYDRVLARVAGRSFTCVLLHDGEVLDEPLPRERHDVPVHAAATPRGLLRLR